MCVLVALPGWASVGRYLFKPESAAAGKPQPEPQDSARTGGKPRAQLGVARQLWEAADNGSPGPGPAPFPFLISLVVFFEAPPPNASAKTLRLSGVPPRRARHDVTSGGGGVSAP